MARTHPFIFKSLLRDGRQTTGADETSRGETFVRTFVMRTFVRGPRGEDLELRETGRTTDYQHAFASQA